MPITKASSSAVAPGAKGELVVGSATNDSAILAVGANGTVLTADSAEATGMKWAAAGGSKTWTLLNTGGTALTAAGTITVSGITKDNLLILVNAASSVNAFTEMFMRFNSDSTSKYSQTGNSLTWQASITADQMQSLNTNPNGDTSINFSYAANSATALRAAAVMVSGAKSSGIKAYQGNSGSNEGANAYSANMRNFMGVFSGSAITTVSIILGSGNFDNGTIYVYEAD